MRKSVPDLIPVRMINEFVFCPRLFYLEFVQGEWADNVFTEDGKAVHRRVNEPSGELAEPEEERPFVARSVALSSPELGACCGIRTNTSTGWGGRDLLGA